MFNIKKISKKFLITSLLLFFVLGLFNFTFSVSVVSASTTSSPDAFGRDFIGDEINLSDKDPRKMASKIINVSLSLLGIIAVVIVIYGGFIWMTSEGNEEKISKAKGILKAGVIGLIIILSAWGITTLVLNKLGDATGVGTGISDDSGGDPNLPPGGIGSGCSSGLGNICQPDSSLCNEGLYCNDNCVCTNVGVGDPCGQIEENICNPDLEPFCPNNLICDNNSCTCRVPNEDDFSELGEICGDDLEGICQSNKKCNSNHNLTCENCKCEGSPVITGISPVGGFCENDINKVCNQDGDCAGDGKCDKDTPNAATGNFITISGYNFGDEYNALLASVEFIKKNIENEEGEPIRAIMPSDVNSYCGNTWSNVQIIAVMPTGFDLNDDVLIKITTSTGKTDRSDDGFGPNLKLIKINSIQRPGLCRIDPVEAKANASITYHGVGLNNSKAYFGNYTNNIPAFAPNNFSVDSSGTANVPLINTGNTSTFAKKTEISAPVPSNFLDFRKLPEPPRPPSISYFDPKTGQAGQYVTIYGSGFGQRQGDSQVYFYNTESDIKASFDFPPVCLQSIWRDNQIIIKVPENIDYENKDYQLKLKIGTWDDVLSTDFFEADSNEPLRPSLCKLNPSSGPDKTTLVSFWGEYFKENNKPTKVIFSNEKLSGELSVYTEDRADKTQAMVPDKSVTGPVKISRDGLTGNSLNFNIKACVVGNKEDCPLGDTCCGPETAQPGACVANPNDCFQGAPDSSVFEWGFDTSFGDSGLLDEDNDNLFSCASYNICPEMYVCPNSPGLCSNYKGGKYINLGSCKNDCSSFAYCGEGGADCEYDLNSDKCILRNSSCSKNISYKLEGQGAKPVETVAVCKTYNIKGVEKNFFEISVNTSCPVISGVRWTMMPGNKCVDVASIENDPSTCTPCPNGTTCSSEGLCYSAKLCPSGSNCFCPVGQDCVDNQCVKKDKSSCDCCCDKTKNNTNNNSNPDCCFPLTCDYSCGDSANADANYQHFGLCSGCGSAEDKDLACNCLGTSGKYCEIHDSRYPAGVCLDCTSLTESACMEHKTTCCWDKVNSTCRGGASDSSVWGNNSINEGYCPYYKCDTIHTTYCSNEINIVGDYKTRETCDIACSDECKKISNINDCIADNNCCWDEKFSACSSGINSRFEEGDANIIGRCKRYDCNENNNACLKNSPNTVGEYLSLGLCDYACKNLPAGFGEKCVDNLTGNNKCEDICNRLDCLTVGGSLGVAPDCGACCCNPSAEEDQCAKVNEKLSCYKDKGICTGNKRGLCCGCSTDSDCTTADLDPVNVGCGADSCCQARPKVISNIPANGDKDVCHNATISISFDQVIDSATIQDNILLLEESSATCSSGTYFISKNYKPSFIEKIKNIFIYKPLHFLAKTFKIKALAGPIGNISSPDKVYCSVLGISEFRRDIDEKSSIIFTPNNLLKAGTNYFVVVKGDANLDSSSGILSFSGIGLSGRGYSFLNEDTNKIEWVGGDDSRLKFNNLNFPRSHIFKFTTMNKPADKGGVCSVEQVLISPDSYLFPENKDNIQENDNDPKNPSFDTERDRDKAYYSYAFSGDNQLLRPVPEYDWTWEWSIGDPNILFFKNVSSWPNDGNKRLLAVKDNVNDGQTVVSATVKIKPSSITLKGNNTQKSVIAYVFTCKNPWPPVNDDGTWSPWHDRIGVEEWSHQYGRYAYEFYYCRDAGDESTSDDLPAFLSSAAIVKEDSLIKICHNSPRQICSTNSDCPAGGLCIVGLLQEAYFFKERIPRFIENASASDLGTSGSVSVHWQSEKDLVDTYKIYYKAKDENVFSEELVKPQDSCVIEENKYVCEYILNNLSNFITYEIKITALSKNLAETNFSTTVSVIPSEGNLSMIPTNLNVEIISQKERLIKISWTAPAGEVSKYKVYRGVSSGVLGSSVLTNDNSTNITISLANTANDSFYFTVSAINPLGVEGEQSAEAFIQFDEESEEGDDEGAGGGAEDEQP